MAFEMTELDHEDSGIRGKRVVLFVGGFLVVVAVMMISLFVYYRETIHSGAIVSPYRTFPGPQLQPNPTRDYANYRKGQDDQLQGYRWVDEGKHVIHVPIDRAMAFVVARGSKAFDPLDGNADAKMPPTPADGQARASAYPQVAPYGVDP